MIIIIIFFSCIQMRETLNGFPLNHENDLAGFSGPNSYSDVVLYYVKIQDTGV